MTHQELKRHMSNIPINVTVGFLYWLFETNDLRGIKEAEIKDYPDKLTSLQKEYNEKYPTGLTGW